MHSVIVGGGFGGVKAALELSKRNVGTITLISSEDYFLHHATLYSTATGNAYAESVVPLREIFAAHPNVTIVKDTMRSVDDHRRLVVGKKGQYHYDALIIAIGSVTNFFGIPGMKERSFGMKTLDEVKAFQNHIHDEVVEKKLDREYFVIGGGATGVELAAALNAYLKSLVTLYRLRGVRSRVTLVEAAPRILPRLSQTASEKVRRRLRSLGVRVWTGQAVESLGEDGIRIDGETHPTSSVVWTSGMANNPFFAKQHDQFELAPNGKVVVNAYLEAAPHIYVIGDNNNIRHSGMAWPALKQATHVAKQLARIKAGKHPRRFHSFSVPCGVPAGEGWSYVEWHGVYLAGRSGYHVRRLMELYGYCQLVPFRVALPLWRAHFLKQVDDI